MLQALKKQFLRCGIALAVVLASGCSASFPAPDSNSRPAALKIYYRFGIQPSDPPSGVTLMALSVSSDGAYRDVTDQAAWSTSTPTVARYFTGGSFGAVGVGTAVMTASYSGLSASTTAPMRNSFVTVFPSLSVNASILIRTISDKGQATAFLSTTSGGRSVTSTASWRSSDEQVATVSSTGLVTAVSTGTVDIFASAEGVTGSYRFSVFPRER